jgi:hypothetical protein
VWNASVAGKGYGQMKIPGTRKQIYAHRLSYLIHYGSFDDELFVCHTCDNPLCVKPSHLFLGTSKDNLQDMKAKDRHLHGSRNKKAKLDEDKVRHIHRMSAEGVSQGELSRMFNVAQSTVWKILHGLRYENIYREFKAAVK